MTLMLLSLIGIAVCVDIILHVRLLTRLKRTPRLGNRAVADRLEKRSPGIAKPA